MEGEWPQETGQRHGSNRENVGDRHEKKADPQGVSGLGLRDRYAGFPLVGDPLYQAGGIPRADRIDDEWATTPGGT